jgi:hypothetical protein
MQDLVAALKVKTALLTTEKYQEIKQLLAQE